MISRADQTGSHWRYVVGRRSLEHSPDQSDQHPVLARLLTPEDFGIVALAGLTVSYWMH